MKILGLLSALVLLRSACLAVETEYWMQSSEADFQKGTLRGLSLRSDGRLSLAPAMRELFDASTAYLWAIAVDSKGNVYTGGGGPGASTSKVFQVDAGGKSKVIAELPALQIQALAIDRSDRVYAATLPDGKVFRIQADGKFDVFYDPKAKYIWALSFSSKGDLYVATGEEGKIHRVAPDGTGSVFFDTEETHARALVVDVSGNVFVGTEPGGLIFRISPTGEGFVMHQSPKREITSLALGVDGALYAAAAGNKSVAQAIVNTIIPSPPAPTLSGSGTPPSGQPGTSAARVLSPSPVAAAPLPGSISVTGGSEVYRILTDGFPAQIWSHPDELVYAITFDSSGRPVVGTGNKGSIHRIDSDFVSTLLIDAGPTQITSFAKAPSGALYAVTGNVGKLLRFGPELEKGGMYESSALDGQSFSYWGRLWHTSELNSGTIKVETRSGNLDRPQKSWSAWVPLDAKMRVASPPARFLQYRVLLTSTQQGQSPEIREIGVARMARNVAPSLQQIEISTPNYKFLQPSIVPTPERPQTLTLAPLTKSSGTAAPVPLDTGSSGSGATLQFSKGSAGARWNASDLNGDTMEYRVEIKGIAENEWKLLKGGVREKYLSFDSSTFADGIYSLRITASDRPSNIEGQAAEAQLESDRFLIDNTPPRIDRLAATRNGGNASVTWSAVDAASAISQAMYSVDGGEWRQVLPTTRLTDSEQHDYTLTLPLSSGEHTVAVKVSDEYDNQAVSKVLVR